ncbi:carbon-nitrogen hydrolase family protein [Actinoplanes sp. NPDC020271]|uniref:carbon-nitrogen hydrolase family protein n=1 Tax=Actinoplanes sp. NPDC020271 TaxID=3363896 RepID=UPI0037A6EB57
MRIACWQPEWVAGISHHDQFLGQLEQIAAAAAGDGASLLVTPEMSATGYHLARGQMAELAEPADGPLTAAVARIAARHRLAVVYGWPERDGRAVYNSVQLVGADGTVAARYRKTHLYGEFDRSSFAPGDDLLVQAKVGAFTVGLIVCYDVEFPETVRAHALAGTELLVVPTALVRPWEFVARTIVPARAFESQLFLAYVNWHSPSADGYCGLSTVAGPDGRAWSRPSGPLLIADLDRGALAAARQATPYLADRRPELYGGVR